MTELPTNARVALASYTTTGAGDGVETAPSRDANAITCGGGEADPGCTWLASNTITCAAVMVDRLGIGGGVGTSPERPPGTRDGNPGGLTVSSGTPGPTVVVGRSFDERAGDGAG